MGIIAVKKKVLSIERVVGCASVGPQDGYDPRLFFCFFYRDKE